MELVEFPFNKPRTRAVTACLPCRTLKSKCERESVHDECQRCKRLNTTCTTVPRQLGRKLGSRNRPKPSSSAIEDALSSSTGPRYSRSSRPHHNQSPYPPRRQSDGHPYSSEYSSHYSHYGEHDPLHHQPPPRDRSPGTSPSNYAYHQPLSHTYSHRYSLPSDEPPLTHPQSYEASSSRSTRPLSPSQQTDWRSTIRRTIDYVERDTPSRQGTPSNSQAPPTFSNMLNVLAKVANDMPPNPLPTSPNGTAYPFDRRRFLDMYRQASRTLDPDPYMGMAVLEHGLDQLFGGTEKDTEIRKGEEIIYQRIDQPRRDLAPEYDVVELGMISEGEVDDLMNVWWTRCHPIIRILDPNIYTIAYLRSTSFTLFTAILQVAAQSLPVSRHSSSLVSMLDTHLDKLFAEVSKNAYQSLEICQALIINTTYLSARKQHHTWTFISRSIAMAIELRLDTNAIPPWQLNDPLHAHISAQKQRRNIQRFWLCLMDWDKRLAFVRGRQPMLKDSSITSTASLRAWYKGPAALDCDLVTCAALCFRNVVAGVQRAIQRKMATNSPFEYETHQSAVDSSLDSWRTEWAPRLNKDDLVRCDHDLRAARFLLLMTPYEHRMNSEGLRGLERDECLVAGLEVCKDAIPFLAGKIVSLQSATAGRLYLICYTSLCCLRVMDTTPRDDERPNTDVDLFHLSILSALAERLCHFDVHPNLALIASVLGRRILYACRKVAASLLAGPGTAPERPADSPVPSVSGVVETGDKANGGGALGMTLGASGQGIGTLGPQDLEFSFDFCHMGDLFNFFDHDFAAAPAS
ncbi:hypothetical protein IAT38_004114 [Cryptococcus sp. DSM 104549]